MAIKSEVVVATSELQINRRQSEESSAIKHRNSYFVLCRMPTARQNVRQKKPRQSMTISPNSIPPIEPDMAIRFPQSLILYLDGGGESRTDKSWHRLCRE
jgi:hypothetical protein